MNKVSLILQIHIRARYLLTVELIPKITFAFSRGYAKRRNDFLLGNRLCKCVTHSDVTFGREHRESGYESLVDLQS